MKQLIIIGALVAATVTVKAQNPGHWDENTGRNVNTESSNGSRFSDVEMTVEGKYISFAHLPKTSDEIRVVVTNTQGEEVAQKSISAMNSAMDLRNLHKGRMYFVNLQYNSKSQKSFTLHL